MLNDSFYNTPEKLDTEDWKLGQDKYSQTVRYAAAAGFTSFCYDRISVKYTAAYNYEGGKYDPLQYRGDHVPIAVKFYKAAIADFDKSEKEQAANEPPFWYRRKSRKGGIMPN
eukprot:2650359-Rhodomonas_salina.1